LAKFIGDEFIVLKIDVKDFISQLSSKTGIKDKITFYLKNNKDLSSPMFNLGFKYTPITISDFLSEYSSILYAPLIISMLCSVFWIFSFLRYNKKELSLKFVSDKQYIAQLTEKLKLNKSYNTELENSFKILSALCSLLNHQASEN
jgi:hypothetical protein